MVIRSSYAVSDCNGRPARKFPGQSVCASGTASAAYRAIMPTDSLTLAISSSVTALPVTAKSRANLAT